MTVAKLKTKKQQAVFLRSAAERLARLGRSVAKLERGLAASNEKVEKLQIYIYAQQRNLTDFAGLIEDFRAELICSRRDVQEMDAKVNRRLAQSDEIGLRIVR